MKDASIVLTFFENLWPVEVELRVIIIFMWLCFLFVLYKIAVVWFMGAKNIKMLEYLQENKSIIMNLKFDMDNRINPESKFEDGKEYYFTIVGARTEILFDHIETLYKSGMQSSKIEPELLCRNTVARIFNSANSIKTYISLFLIIGILGTLFGLANSIGSFDGAALLSNNVKAGTGAQELQDLFKNLKGAFAPSMWGVLTTIVGVLIYTVLIQEKTINNFTDKLTKVTIDEWMPSLCRTDYQKIYEAAKQVEKANKSIENAEEINDGVNELRNNLNEANATIVSFKNMTEEFSYATKTLKDSADAISANQESLKNTYENLEAKNEEVNKTLSAVLMNINAFGTFGKKLEDLNSNFYDKHVRLQADLEESIEITKDVAVNLGDKGEELAQRVERPIVNQLCEVTDAIGNIYSKLHEINDPLKSTEKRIYQSVEAIGKVNNDLIDKIDNLIARIDEREKDVNKHILNKNGFDPAVTEKIIAQANSNKVDTSKIEDGLKEVVTCLKSLQDTNHHISDNDSGEVVAILKEIRNGQSGVKVVANQNEGFLGTVKKFMPIIIAVMLFFSLFVQGYMAYRIVSLEQNQKAVTDIVVKQEQKRIAEELKAKKDADNKAVEKQEKLPNAEKQAKDVKPTENATGAKNGTGKNQ